MGTLRFPLDPFPYTQDPRSRKLHSELRDGDYVFVADRHGEIYVLPDGPHLHSKVLGNGEPASYAGDMTIENGVITHLTNLSGTFQFDDPAGLRDVCERCRAVGYLIRPQAVKFFDPESGHCEVLE